MADTPVHESILAVSALERGANTLIRAAAPPDDVVADVAGRVRKVERDLADYRRGLLAETPDVEGKDYKLVTSRRSSRSFNSVRIISDVADAIGGDFVSALNELRMAGALKFTWTWTKLEQFFGARQLDLEIRNKEITDDGNLDAPHVGVKWSEYTRVEGKKED